MKNKILDSIKSKLIIKITGKNYINFIKRIKNNNIDLLNIKYNNDYIIVTIYKKDYDRLIQIKTIYDIEIIDYKGLNKIANTIFYNKIILFLSLLSITIIYILSNMIFSIDVITNDSKTEILLINELKNYGIKKHSFKKSYNSLNKIKQQILNKYKDKIEWLEIESIGTKYIVKYEPRIINKNNNNYTYRNIIAKKDSIITSINVHAGEIVKEINTYVKKGEIIVTGKINLNEETKEIVSATGIIYGEVWYMVNIKYPLNYYEEIETGNNKTILSINFLSKRINIFNHYKTHKLEDNIIIKNNILPISITYTKEKEIIIIDERNNKKEAIDKAIEKSKTKLNERLNNNEYIKDYKIINKNIYDNYVELNIFFTVIEDITEYEEIIE